MIGTEVIVPSIARRSARRFARAVDAALDGADRAFQIARPPLIEEAGRTDQDQRFALSRQLAERGLELVELKAGCSARSDFQLSA